MGKASPAGCFRDLQPSSRFLRFSTGPSACAAVDKPDHNIAFEQRGCVRTLASKRRANCPLSRHVMSNHRNLASDALSARDSAPSYCKRSRDWRVWGGRFGERGESWADKPRTLATGSCLHACQCEIETMPMFFTLLKPFVNP